VRVLATTNSDLREKVRAGEFREDLYFRLEVVPLRVPALRERRDDVLLLAAHFIREAAAENERPAPGLSPEATERLLHHDWPGNVRELRNAIERAVILCPGGELRAEHLVLEMAAGFRRSDEAGSDAGDALADRERAWILQVLRETGGNRTAAARRLGVSVRTVRNKLALYEREGVGMTTGKEMRAAA